MNTPLAAHFKLSLASCPPSDNEVEYMPKVTYVSAADSLMYTKVCSHPDLSQLLSVVSRYMANPCK